MKPGELYQKATERAYARLKELGGDPTKPLDWLMVADDARDEAAEDFADHGDLLCEASCALHLGARAAGSIGDWKLSTELANQSMEINADFHSSHKLRARSETELEEAAVVAAYAEISALKKRIQELEKGIGDDPGARERALDLYEGHGLTALQGDEGVVTLTPKQGSLQLKKELVAQYLTGAQMKECQVRGKGQVAISFTPRGG
jgi:hypothetical protein